MKSLLLPLLLLSTIAVEAQESQQPGQQQPRKRVILPPGGDQARPAGPEMILEENVTLTISGKTPDGTTIDFAMTGTGPVFHMDQPGESHSFITHQHEIRRTESRYAVSYSIGLRIRIETARSGDSVNHEFRDVVLRSTALCDAGKPMVITRSGGNELTLVIEEEAGKRQARGAAATGETLAPSEAAAEKVENPAEATEAHEE